MSILGTILATPFRILNVPNRVMEKLVDPNSELGDDDNLLSKPLETIAKALEEIDE